jgi:hypothetical protein
VLLFIKYLGFGNHVCRLLFQHRIEEPGTSEAEAGLQIVAEVALTYGINTYFLHAGSNLSERLQSLMIGKDDAYSFYLNLIKNWPKFSENTYSLGQYKKVTEHFKELLNAKSIFTYSVKKSLAHNRIRSFFGIPDSSKILVATMASYDEEVAAEFIGAKKTFDNEIFFNQIAWIKELISYAKEQPNVFLVIRPHPREFANKREQKTSEHARQILELIASGLPLNVRFNLPADSISIYDFIDEADVFLNSWSKNVNFLERFMKNFCDINYYNR